jgi:hypothetical protein
VGAFIIAADNGSTADTTILRAFLMIPPPVGTTPAND